MKIIKYTGLIAAFILTVSIANARIPKARFADKHEYSVYLSGGMSNLVYGLSADGKQSGGFGFGAGLEYMYNINENFGISAGIGVSTFGGKASFASLSEEYNGIDDNGDRVKYRYSLKDFEEKQNILLLSVPVKAQYKTPVSESMHFFIAGGFKLGFPASAESKIMAGELTSSGYYDFESVNYTSLPVHGFFNGQQADRTGSIDAGIAVILSLESGLRFALGNNALYAGLYLDYAISDMKQSNDKHILNYNRDLTYESVLNTSLANKLSLTSVGVKLKFSLF